MGNEIIKPLNETHKACAGDALLRYALIKIFANTGIAYAHKLGQNKVLSEIVCHNPAVFGFQGEHVFYKNAKRLGNVFEAYIYNVCEVNGIEVMVNFVYNIYDPVLTKGKPDSYETYLQWYDRREKRYASYISPNYKYAVV